jgi:hypothetical protein
LETSDARAFSREFFVLIPDAFANALKQTPLSRAKLLGLTRNARAVLVHLV